MNITTNHPTCADCNAPFDLNWSHTSCPVCGGFAAGARKARPMSVVRKGEVIAFESDLSDNEAATICERMTWSSFAQDLAVKYETHRGLSPKQLAWAHYLAVEQLRRDAAPKPVNPTVGGIHELLHRMAETGKAKQKSRVAVYWRGLRLSISSDNAKVPGAITVTSDAKNYDERVWFGRILESGEFQASRRADAKVTEALDALSAEPTEEALAREGRVSGVCCRCNAELTDDTSKTLGFGPTCAKYLGLKHGKRAAAAVREAAVVISAEAIEAAASEVVECHRQADGSYEFVRVA